ncbi:MAG: DUF4266 domain-containing protein [Gammaproteobacteria bacterium]|nr:DUF4266 domain-containing protein [Gammaproteobacteria bacterium]MDH5729872.1 DUF4266 domain-containing protein [Gammaproteobacteria bacterium]
MRLSKTILTLLLSTFLLSGCLGYETVKPWHRDVLAHENAQLVADALENSTDNHIYFSKEAASGGDSVGGGGCGCN